MSVNFDWQVSEEEFDVGNRQHQSTPPWKRWAAVIVLITVAGAIGSALWWQVYSAELQLRRSAQFVLDLEHQAYLEGDGEHFFSVYDPNNIFFRSAQLRPDQIAIQTAGQKVTHAEIHGDIIWANVQWQAEGETRQRIQFFEQTENGIIHIAGDPNYWGEWQERAFPWGTLRLRAADAQWSQMLGDRLGMVLTQQLVQTDHTNRPTVVIRDDFSISTNPNIINFPSPRLLGLDDEGNLTNAYLNRLGMVAGDHFRPITLRFAMPNRPALDTITDDFLRAAKQFTTEHTNGQVRIELLLQEDLVGPPEEWLPTVDAALLPATEQLIAAGLIQDLTQLAVSDTSFDHGDFYPQAWRGSWWDERMWMVPWNMHLNLLFFNANQFEANSIALPEPAWDWDTLSEALARFPEQPTFIDSSRETLFAYALAQDRRCRNRENCLPQLTPESVGSALEWYRRMAVEQQIVNDVSALPQINRDQAIMQSLSAYKEMAVWVDAPINYEYQIYLQKTGVLPFLPVSAETPLVMPVRISGIVMSSNTAHAYWTWQWLKFVSHIPPSGSLQRTIPARPSVVRQTSFWAWTPERLAQPMQAALPFARPLLIGEERYFSWDMLAAAVEGEAVTAPPNVRWFGR